VFAKDNRAGRVFVREVPPDMGAARAGLQEGDEVTAIDGRSVRSMSPDEVHRALAGKVGSSVTLTVVRDGVPREIRIERGPLKPPPQTR
jgi:carboxyl-terminal processing protease